MRDSVRTLLWAATIVCCAAAFSGCTSTKAVERRQYAVGEDAQTMLLEGRRLAAAGQPLLALARFDRATRIAPIPTAWFEMGRLYEAMGKRDRAAVAYSQALQLSVDDWPDARFALLALGYQVPGKPAAAEEIQQARRWAAAHPVKPVALSADDVESAPLTAEQLQARRQEVMQGAAERREPTVAEVAAVIFAPGSQTQPLPSAENPVYGRGEGLIIGTYAYHMDRAQAYSRRGQYDLAADEYLRAMQIDPKQIDPRLEIGDMMMRLERYTQAQFHYEEAGRQFPASPRPEVRLGVLAMKMKQNDEARADFDRALKKDPRLVEALSNLGAVAMLEKDWPEAARQLDRALGVNADYPSAVLNRGLVAEAQRDKPTALRFYRRYLELNGPRSGEVKNWIQNLDPAGNK